MDDVSHAARRAAVEQAKANSGLSGLKPTEYGLSVYEQWIAGLWSADEAIALLIQHHKELEGTATSCDQLVAPNKLGITNSVRMKRAEADITTLRMAELAL